MISGMAKIPNDWLQGSTGLVFGLILQKKLTNVPKDVTKMVFSLILSTFQSSLAGKEGELGGGNKSILNRVSTCLPRFCLWSALSRDDELFPQSTPARPFLSQAHQHFWWLHIVETADKWCVCCRPPYQGVCKISAWKMGLWVASKPQRSEAS